MTSCADENFLTHSTAAFAGAEYNFFAFRDNENSDPAAFISKVVRKLDQCALLKSVLRLEVYVKDTKTLETAGHLLKKAFAGPAPPITKVIQPPLNGSGIEILAWAVNLSSDTKIVRLDSGLLKLSHPGHRWVYTGGITSPDKKNIYDESTACFKDLKKKIGAGGMTLDALARAWIYVPRITQTEETDQRYKIQNRARAEVFAECSFEKNLFPGKNDGPVYPASTGIGTSAGNYTVSGIAWQPDKSSACRLPLENPRQTSAFEYSEKYGKFRPLFSRAMAVVDEKDVLTFVSGTASITSETSRHASSLEQQTSETIENIRALISKENFARHEVSVKKDGLKALACARIYVKNSVDFSAVEKICRAELGQIPQVFIQADICRPELLVEIEAIAFSPRRQAT